MIIDNFSTKTVFVCGAGHQGFSMAAHLTLNGVDVKLWNRSQKHIQEVIDTGVIHCSGIVNGDAKIGKTSTDMAEVVSDFVMVTTPSSAHKDIAKELAPYVHPGMIIVLNPGRTFGAIDFAEELKRQGVNELPQIAETQTIVYTCRKTGPNSTSILALKKDVEIAAIRGSDINYIMERMPECLKPYFTGGHAVHFLESLNRDIDWQHEFEKLEHIVVVETYPLSYGRSSLNDWIESLFREWKHRGNFTSFSELREYLGYGYTVDRLFNYKFAQGIDQSKYFLYCEMIVNLVLPRLTSYTSGLKEKYDVFIKTVIANLDLAGYEWRMLDEQYIIVLKNAPANEAIEIEPSLKDSILEYNHYRLKGDLKRKKELLNHIAQALEPMRKELEEICKQETSDFFYMVNNMDVRHNNCDPRDQKKYNPFFSGLTLSEKEEWYDTIYSQALALFVRNEQVTRNQKIAQFKQSCMNTGSL